MANEMVAEATVQQAVIDTARMVVGQGPVRWSGWLLYILAELDLQAQRRGQKSLYERVLGQVQMAIGQRLRTGKW